MKLIITTFLISATIVSVFAQSLTIDASAPIAASISFEGGTATGTYDIIYGAGSSSVTKPFIIVEGWDLLDENQLLNFYYDDDMYEDLIDDLHNDEHDIVFLNFDNSGDLIQRNAYLLVKMIQIVNALKQSAGSSEHNSILGFSLGGVIARYALAYMESQNMSHKTINFISHDSPQTGANVPLSLQFLASDSFWSIFSLPTIFNIYEANPAVRQILLYDQLETISNDFEPSPGARFDSFQADILGLNPGSLGYPEQTKNIGLSNGSKHLWRQRPQSGSSAPRLSPGDDLVVVDVTVTKVFGAILPYEYIGRAGYGNWREVHGNNVRDFSSNLPGYDVVSGSRWRTFQIDVVDVENIVPVHQINEFTIQPFAFIPTLSALNIGFDDPWATEGQNITTSSCHTPFDVVFAEDNNSSHAQLSNDAKDFIINEMLTAPVNYVETDQIIISNTTITSNQNYEAAGINFTSNVTINSGVLLEASSENFEIQGPFEAKTGSVLEIKGGGGFDWDTHDSSCYVAPSN